MQQFEVRQVVDVDFVEEGDDDCVAAEAEGADWGTKGELADAAGDVVVPKEGFGVGVRVGGGGGRRGAHEGEELEAEQHGDEGKTGVEVATKLRAIRFGAEDEEATVGGRGEAGIVLVEGDVVDG